MSDDNSIKIWRAFVETWKLWKRSVDSNFTSVKLDSTSYSVLRNLAENGPTTMVRMASLTNVTQGWITGIIDNLEKQGLVVRRRSSEDRRKIDLIITDSGMRRFKEAKKLHLDFIKQCLSGIDDSSAENLLKSLETLKNSISGRNAPLEKT
jgi:MarR family 2-MHQ and catechol resistance regulon transcriptional repressor